MSFWTQRTSFPHQSQSINETEFNRFQSKINPEQREFGKDLTNICDQVTNNAEIDNLKNTFKNIKSKKDSVPLYNGEFILGKENYLSSTQNTKKQVSQTCDESDSLIFSGSEKKNNQMEIDSCFNKIQFSQSNPPSTTFCQFNIDKAPKAQKFIDFQTKNPQKVPEYIFDIYQCLKEEEIKQRINYDYMRNQSDINEKMRSILVDWIVEVILKFKLKNETLHLTINIIDRYLEKINLQRNQLQLVGVASMLIACKYEEIYSPEIRDFVYITDKAYTKDQILQMENSILSNLNFEMTSPSSLRILELFAELININDNNILFFAFYLLEIFQINLRVLKYLPSLQAASVLYLSMRRFKRSDLNLVSTVSGYTEFSIRECCQEICNVFEIIQNSTLSAVKKKYSLTKYNEVAKISLI